MKDVYGDTKSLRSSVRTQLEKLTQKRSHPTEVIDVELVKKTSQLCSQIGVQLGLLIGRDGRVTHVVVGSRDRIYLPDLGRFRLDNARLRRLRLVLFVPEDAHTIRTFPRQDFLFGKTAVRGQRPAQVPSNSSDMIAAPEIAPDILTDLEKLRLDAVLVLSVPANGIAASVSLAYLHPETEPSFTAQGTGRERGIGFYHARTIHELDVDFGAFLKQLEATYTATRVTGFDTGKDKAVLVGAYTGKGIEASSSMEDLKVLARTAEIAVLDIVIQRRRTLDPKTVIGKGKIEEIVLHCLALGADLLIFDQELTPGQLRSVTNLTELRVIDRSMLILDIFAQRAKSSEGRLQVELAQLKYSLPRLTERDTGLSRLTGGIGGRGPGETKLEIGRRRARDRVSELEKRIEKIAMQRGVRRERRQSRGVPVIAIVGYTNAGKSTLLNALTKGNVLAESKLFATLDPTSRRMRFPNDHEVIFVDTVGFIRDLPKELVNAFRATLEEVGEADCLLHVADATNPEVRRQIAVVQETLHSLGVEEKSTLLLLNKVDLLSALEVKTLQNSVGGVPISGVTRLGFPELIEALQAELVKTFGGLDPGRFTETTPW